MTTHTMAAGDDPRRLLAHARELTRRVRVAQRVTWLPLLVLAVVTFAAFPAALYGWRDFDCTAAATGQVCHTRNIALIVYWQVAAAVAYVTIAYVYLRAARARGLGGRVLPYVVTGIAMTVLVQLVALLATHSGWWEPGAQPSALLLFTTRLVSWGAAIGIALLVLAWLERNVALLLFTAGYLAVVLVPVTFGWGPLGMGNLWFLPSMVIQGGTLLLGGLGFALAQRPWRHR